MKRKRKPPAPGPPAGDLSFVVDFVNTRDPIKEKDTWTSPAELAEWLERRRLVGQAGELGPAELERAVAARHGLRSLILANSGGELDAKAVAALDEAVRGASCGMSFEDDGEMRLAAGEESFNGALGRICGAVALAKAADRWRRMKICRNPHCRRAYYDESAFSRRPYCTEKCRDRLHSRNYRRKSLKRHGRVPRR